MLKPEQGTGLLSAVIIALSSCAAEPPKSNEASRQGSDILRNCATVTANCPGIRRIQVAIPGDCEATANGPACLTSGTTSRVGTSSRRAETSYREVLAAMDTSAGICALQAIYSGNSFGPGEYAVLGIWATHNGIQQYRKAHYLRAPIELESIDTPQTFSDACQKLSTSIS